ncbi:MAG: hypothetical protein HY562_09875 [Ignavibacteriales bacterium]|nr:hypothetical protein [Ignavibacteriales bacterium]
MITRYAIAAAAVLIFLTAPIISQPLKSPHTTGAALWESVAIDSKVRSFAGNNEYGSLAAAGMSLSLFSIDPILDECFFGRDVTLMASAGAGSWYQKGNLDNGITIEFVEVGFKVPLLNVTNILGLRDEVGLSVLPSMGFPSMRNYVTGNFWGVPTRGIGIGVDVEFFDFVTASLEYHWTRVDRKSFLWADRYETIALGLSFALGKELQKTRMTNEYNEALRQRVRWTEDSLIVLANELRASSIRNRLSDSSNLVHEVRVLAEEIRALKNEMSGSRLPTTELLADASHEQGKVRIEGSVTLSYDKNRLPRIKVMRIEKKIFEGGDLVEEDYLKNILAVITNYDGYVWEIAYRDAEGFQGSRGEELAGKIQNFFEIYNSKFRKKFQVVHDAAISTEFEIRCLGMVNP